jgi:hypothetical protein
MGLLRASKQFAMPQATLRGRAANNKLVTGISKGLGHFSATSGPALKTGLMEHSVCLECRLSGMTRSKAKQLAYQLEEKSGISHRFSEENKMPGWELLKGFRKQNPDTRLRTLEDTPIRLLMGFNKRQISIILTEISGSPGGNYKECYLLECDAV